MADSVLLEELHRDIWRPFVDIYADRDTAAFAALHASELIRVEAASGWSGGLPEYATRVGAFFDDMTVKGAGLGIAFRFVERIVSGEVASERGVYRIVMAVPGEDERTFYGRFHTFARKTDGRWRIVVDYDTDRDVDATDFEAAQE